MSSPGKASLERRLAERFRELAALTILLQEQEAAFIDRGETIDWLCEVVAAIYWDGGWRGAWRAKRLRRRLQARGLFDGDAYLDLNPDVAQSGADPLIHYLRHGFVEGRPKGPSDLQDN